MRSFQETLWKSSHTYTLMLHLSLSAGLTRNHFPRSIAFTCYTLNSWFVGLLILCFKACIHWQAHWVFSITHCRQWHCSGMWDAFWLKLGKVHILISFLSSVSAVVVVRTLFQALTSFCNLWHTVVWVFLTFVNDNLKSTVVARCAPSTATEKGCYKPEKSKCVSG